MNITKSLTGTTLLSGFILLTACTTFASPATNSNAVKQTATNTVEFQQIRNATIKLDYDGTTFLVDPMLAAKNAYPGFEGTVNSQIRYPMVDLPISVEEVLKADAIILTHLHADHWDDAARNLVPRDMPIFTQDEADAAIVRKDGFTDVRVLTEQGVVFKGTKINKTIGQHGTDAMYKVPALAQLLGKTMGIVFQKPNYKTVYVVGDTIWHKEVEDALTRYKPDAVILNTGYAQLTTFVDDSIIMGKDDVYRAYKFSPNAQIVSVHMDTVNHATLTKAELCRFIEEKHLNKQRALVPNDGQTYKF
ncbi:MBL fold metallo-hydrolase [Psychrobacter sp. CLB018]|jgi:L-ascorbate metabolism protein UlaG (beta-lactamase superfamily)|uniref:MBL fold metallo-hydrolase n=1 Tax=Psychrobacter sp. CLB018 TaxID=3240930 RepID=UPI003514FAE4